MFVVLKYSEFAFWGSTWEIIKANANKLGINALKLIRDKCILEENWVSATFGCTGISHNSYSVKTKQ